MAMAHRSPFLVRLSCRPVIRPAIVTVAPSGLPSSPFSDAMDVSAAWCRMCSIPKSGWSET